MGPHLLTIAMWTAELIGATDDTSSARGAANSLELMTTVFTTAMSSLDAMRSQFRPEPAADCFCDICQDCIAAFVSRAYNAAEVLSKQLQADLSAACGTSTLSELDTLVKSGSWSASQQRVQELVTHGSLFFLDLLPCKGKHALVVAHTVWHGDSFGRQ